MAKGGGLLELMGLLAGRIPGASRAKGGVGTAFDWLRKAVTPSIEPFRQGIDPATKRFGPFVRGSEAWPGRSGYVRREGRGGAAAIDPGDPRILHAMLARPRNLAKLGGAAGLGLGGYALMSSEEDLPEEVAQVVEEQDKAVVENITGEEDIGKTPSWLRPLLTGLGAYAGYKRSGLMGGLVGGAGGYGISELLKKNPGMYDWIKGNPELATMLGFLGADALRGGGGGSSDIPSYQPYSPLTYESLGGYAPSTEMPQMAQGGIAGGGSSGLNGLRTGLRDAIVNSIDDPNRQGVNSFVPSMLKAYDEIPKLQAGGISGGANPGFVDPGKQAVQQQQSQSGFNQAAAGSYGLGSVDPSRMALTTGIGNQMQRASSLHQGGVGGSGTNISGITSQGYNPRADTTGVNPITNTSGTSNGPGTGAGTVPGIGSGYDPMTSAIGQNILEQRAAMGGLGSNMTDISLARGMAPHMAGLQNQWFNQQMGMEGFNQRERENMARFGLQAAALENQRGYTPYTNQYFRAGGVG